MTQLDPERTLALAYVPAGRRPGVEALWQLDAALGAALAGGREPMVTRIKLAWWREALEGLGAGAAPAEPTLEAVATYVIPQGIKGADLALLEDAWSVLLSEEPLSPSDLRQYAAARGGALFRLTAKLLGEEATSDQEAAGGSWALADLARHSGKSDAEAALALAGEVPLVRWPARLRPIGMLAALARRDAQRGLENLEPQGAPGRVLRMLGHRLTGR